MSLYSIFQRLPIIKTIVKIANHYAYDADPRAGNEFAPLRLWIRTIGATSLFAALLSAVALSATYEFKIGSGWSSLLLRENFNQLAELLKQLIGGISVTPKELETTHPLINPGELVLDVFPDLLGFGIGVYALIFSLSAPMLQLLQTHIEAEISAAKRIAGSALLLNASMGYPLLIITLALLVAVFQKLFPENKVLLVLAWFGFWYGCIVLIELIGVLFGLGENDALDKLDESTKLPTRENCEHPKV